MVLDPISQSLPVHFFGSRPQPPTSLLEAKLNMRVYIDRSSNTDTWIYIDRSTRQEFTRHMTDKHHGIAQGQNKWDFIGLLLSVREKNREKGIKKARERERKRERERENERERFICLLLSVRADSICLHAGWSPAHLHQAQFVGSIKGVSCRILATFALYNELVFLLVGIVHLHARARASGHAQEGKRGKGSRRWFEKYLVFFSSLIFNHSLYVNYFFYTALSNLLSVSLPNYFLFSIRF